MSFLSFLERLAETSGSIALHESRYMYLIVLTVHVLTLCVFVGMSLIVDLRLLGATMRNVPVSEMITRLSPWIITGFVVMVVSGSLMFYAAPIDKYENLFFRAKMGMLILAGINLWIFFKRLSRNISEWDLDPVPPTKIRLAGGAGIVLWAAIITAGRMIPYQQYWFD